MRKRKELANGIAERNNVGRWNYYEMKDILMVQNYDA